MANRTRNIVLRVPVTAQEWEMIELKMQQMGTRCFSVYALKMLIDGYVIKIDYSDIKAMTAELQKIGTNINQIARRVNATGTIYAQDIEDIKGVLNEISSPFAHSALLRRIAVCLPGSYGHSAYTQNRYFQCGR